MIVQLYIQGERVDMFEEESITISDSIQNIRDIGKIFTSFSRTFNIPASKVNNKIFKHYYNSDIENGFDARFRVNSTIEVNNTAFKTGFIQLEGVDLKNNIPYKYRVTFFGDVVDLKNKLGEDKLSDIGVLSDYNVTYSAEKIKEKLTTAESSTNHVICPLITHTQELFYKNGEHGEDTGNLWYESGSGTSHHHGVKYNELKYAIRVNKIIEAIENKYDLQFSNDFFKNTNLDEFNNLFLWLHRKSGKVEDLSGISDITTRINSWANSVDAPFEMNNGNFEIYGNPDYVTSLTLLLDPNSVNDTQEYDILVKFNGEKVYELLGHTGNKTIIAGQPDTFLIEEFGDYEVFVTTEGQMTFDNVRWSATYTEPGFPVISVTYSTGSFLTSGDFLFQIDKQMPEIKVLDFITGLFNAFNLTAYVDNNIIIVKPLNDFYDSGKGATSTTNGWDITDYVDVTESSEDATTIYKEVIFKFKDTKTILANKYGEIENKTWGEESYKIEEDNLSSDKTYKIEIPFGKMMYERLIDESDGVTEKNIQWGYSVDKSQNAYLGSPLLFYPIHTSTGAVSFINDVNDDNVAIDHQVITNVNLPSNSPSFSSTTNPFQFSFYEEDNEYSKNEIFSETLFSEYYKDYIEDIFNKKNRLTKVSAYLPLNIILNYNLADRIIIGDKSYKINLIDTDFKTGKSEIELIGDL